MYNKLHRLSAGTFIRQSPTLYRFFKPFASWYANAAGYRKYGLKHDDLLMEEGEVVQKVCRCPPRALLLVPRDGLRLLLPLLLPPLRRALVCLAL